MSDTPTKSRKTIVASKGWSDSCDFCASQEGRHYCLLHARPMKNMDTIRCADWTPKPETKGGEGGR